jgi:DNA-binding transcriptional ArsR family regulator
MKIIKTAKQMERHVKGIANHHRIEILFLIARREGITLEDIFMALKTNKKTTSEHTRRLYHAGLITKNYQGRNVEHRLSPYGRLFVQFLKSFQSL